MKSSWSILLGVAFVTSVFFSTQVIQAGNAVLRAAGCKTEYFLFKDLAQDFSKNTGGKLLPAGVGNKKAVKLLMEKKLDFIFTCKPVEKLVKGLKLNPEDVKGWKDIHIAMDPIVVVTNPTNGVKNLTTEQLTLLFAGNINNWKELGGNDLPVHITYLNPKLESGVVLLFKEFTVGSKGKLGENARFGDGPSQLGNYVTMTPGAVTFMGFNSYKEKYGEIIEIDGILPSRANIVDGSYKLTATYYMIMDERSNPAVDDFISFINSNAGKESIEMNFIAVTEQ